MHEKQSSNVCCNNIRKETFETDVQKTFNALDYSNVKYFILV
jgi:hypothetical protein